VSSHPEHGPGQDEQGDEGEGEGEERVRLTPGLLALGILALALGVLSGLVMSARALAP